MLEWINQLISMAMGAISQGSPVAVITLFLVVALTECGIPFPFILDSVLFFTSYQAAASPWHVVFVMLIVFLGRQCGAALIYWLTRIAGNAVIYWFGKRYKYLKHNWAKLTLKLSSHAPMAIAVVRVSGFMTLASLVSGTMKIRYPSFVLGVALSALIFDGALILLGLITKYGFQVIGFTPSVWHIAVGLITIMTIVMIVMKYLPGNRNDKSIGAPAGDVQDSVDGDSEDKD
jgi:membrane protein DedA with SNARE-associated domain